ncbi:beta-lactamase family protein [Thozetella sp. PMI_491]|nr:beta-lactamase family protein [Thozetella sp. PMI_491]
MDTIQSHTFASHVEELMSRHHVPGLAIAVVQDDQVASAGYGHASLEPPIPCTADTIFDVGSAAKSLTAAAVALLVDDNEKYPEVQYHATMSSLLPDDFVMSEVVYTEGVTLDDVLSHRSGMPRHDNSYMGPGAAVPDDAGSITRNLRNLPVAAPLRARYIYCNMMYTAVTHLVQVKTGQSFASFLHDHFFQPLGMPSTALQPSAARANGLGERIATGYSWRKDSSSYHGFQSPDCPEGQGAGSIVSSAKDFILWVKALVNHEDPINERIYQGLVRLRSFPNPSGKRLKRYRSPAFYAAGIEVYYYRGYAVVGHDGNVPGFASRFFFLPDLRFGGVILGNSADAAPLATILSRELIDRVLQVPEQEEARPPRAREAHGSRKGGLPRRPNIPPQKQAKQKKENRGADSSEKPEPRESHLSQRQVQQRPLEAYTGQYWNAGYHGLTVQVRDGQLFIDATDRSNGFTLTFEHLRDQTIYVAHLTDSIEGGDDPVEAEFKFDKNRAVRLGLRLEEILEDKIWFERIEN